MNKLKIAIYTFFVFSLLAPAISAKAGSVTFADKTISFPDYYNSNYPKDEYGTPMVSSMTVTWNDSNGFLESVLLSLHDNSQIQDFDSLFINADYYDGDTNLENWDYFVHSGGQTNILNTNGTVPKDGLYSVDETPGYTLNKSGGRVGQPNGIQAQDLTFISTLTRTHIAGSYTISYDFSGTNINIGPTFAIAYAPWCANDNIIVTHNADPVPEPATMLLFGSGLAGLAGFTRLRRAKK